MNYFTHQLTIMNSSFANSGIAVFLLYATTRHYNFVLNHNINFSDCSVSQCKFLRIITTFIFSQIDALSQRFFYEHEQLHQVVQSLPESSTTCFRVTRVSCFSPSRSYTGNSSSVRIRSASSNSPRACNMSAI